MNRKKFIDEMYKLGFKVEKVNYLSQSPELAISQNDKVIAYVSETHLYKFDLNSNFEKLNDYIKERVYKTVVTYAATPMEEREDKKFYLRLKGVDNCSSYLNKGKFEDNYFFSDSLSTGVLQTEFTPKDIKQLPSELLEMYSNGHIYVDYI